MSDAQAAVGLRVLGARDSLIGSPRDSLENIITNQLPDGALCWVTAALSYFVFRRGATVPPFVPDGVTIIAPIGGPGLWFRLDTLLPTGVADGASAFFFTLDTPIVIAAPATYPLFTSLTDAGFVAGADNLNFTHAAGVLTYTGLVPKRFVISAQVTTTEGTGEEGGLAMIILRNGLVPAVLNVGSNPLGGDVPVQTTARSELLLATGDTIQIGLAYNPPPENLPLNVFQATIVAG